MCIRDSPCPWKYLIIRDAMTGVANPAICCKNRLFQKTLQNHSSFHKTLRFSSINACSVQLQKQKYNAEKKEAAINHHKWGKNKIHNAPKRFDITDNINDFFLHIVSANTDVGISKIHDTNVNTFDIIIISITDNHVYL